MQWCFNYRNSIAIVKMGAIVTPRLCCEKLGTSHDVKGFAINSFLERIVIERANDDLCQKNVKKAGLISAKPIDS